MDSYNSRLVAGTTLDVSVPEDYKPEDHSCRLLRLINDELVIGTVVSVDQKQGYAALTFPMHVGVLHCDEHDEEEMYEFMPYLRNLVPFDIQHPRPVIFNLAQCINAVEPSEHLVRNYHKVLLLKKAVSDEMLGLRRRKETMH